jgi:3-oxoacyl-[acyl-carrier protein] reductase
MGPDLGNRTAIVTGGSGFLGRDIVAGLRAAGCRVVILDCVVDGSSLQADVIRIACDLADPIVTEAAVRRAWDEAGPISILVNAAGSIQNAPLVNVTARGDRRHSFEAWRSTIDANLTSVFLATVNHVDRMVAARTRGVVVSLSSVAAVGNAGQAAYSAAKAGVNAMTLAWAKELGLLGIRFVAVAPGFIDTASTHAALSEEAVKDLVKKTPLRRLGKASEITAAVLFAVNNEHLTGKVLEIDGGMTL